MSPVRLVSCAMLSLALLVSATANADYVRAETFPRAVSPYGNVQICGLPGGLLLVWDGSTIYKQTIAGGDQFQAIGAGYIGDPGFMALSPDGHTLVLGAGYSGDLYRFDVAAPADYSAEALIGNVSHYWGVMLNETLLLVDRPTDDYSTDELAIVDVSAATPTATTVMLKPASSGLAAGEYAASAALAIDRTRTTVYAMECVYVLDPYYQVVSNQLKSISAQALIDAYSAKAVLDWNVNATAIGSATEFGSGGPVAVTNDGDLLIAATDGAERVDPATASVVEVYAPAGTGYIYYTAAYNAYTDEVFPIATDMSTYTLDLVYAPEGALASLPAASAAGLALLFGVLGLGAARRIRR